MSHRFHILDVFAERPFTGNPLAVVERAEGISDQQMLEIAREFDYSETTFILGDQPREGGWDVRIFTPGGEVPFAGHPTVGTAWLIRERLAEGRPEEVVLNLKVGRIPVRRQVDGAGAETLWMQQQTPTFGRTVDTASVAAALGLRKDDFLGGCPIQEVSTGLPFLIVPLNSLRGVEQCRVDRQGYNQLIAELDAKAIYVFCLQTLDTSNHVHARMFADFYGVPEDPATGSAAGCLAAWLAEHGARLPEKLPIEQTVRIEQGYEMGRPSLIAIRGVGAAPGIEVRVGGQVFAVAHGELHRLGAVDKAAFHNPRESRYHQA